MKRSNSFWTLIIGIAITVFVGVALYLRMAIPYEHVFSGEFIKLAGVDSWYHLRLIENLVAHYPESIIFDPFTQYPHGSIVFWPPFFDFMVATIIMIAGLGSPTTHTIETVAAYFPAVLGALTIVPVYFIGKTLFSRWAGIIAAGLLAIMPGEFLGRTILGFTDHHVAEVFFSTVTLLFLILAVKTGQQRGLTLHHLKTFNRQVAGKPLLYGLLAGVFFGIFILSWVGGLLLLLLVFIYIVVQFVIDHLKRRPTEYLGIIGTLIFTVTAIVSFPFLPQSSFSMSYVLSLGIAIITPLVLAIVSILMARHHLKSYYYPAALIVTGSVLLAILYFTAPSLFAAMWSEFRLIFIPSSAALTISEVDHLLFPSGEFTFAVAWLNFSTGFFVSFIALIIVIYHVIKRGEADKTMLLVWSLFMLAAVLSQRRFGYYYAVNVALLSGYISYLFLNYIGLNEIAAQQTKAALKEKNKKIGKRKQGGAYVSRRRATVIVGLIVIIASLFLPNFVPNGGPTLKTVREAMYIPDAWYESLAWLKDNSEAPFNDPDYYFDTYERPQPGEDYDYSESSYSVLAWWDFGHWITRIAQRIPIANPFLKGSSTVAGVMTSQDLQIADELANELSIRYVMLDKDTTTTKFLAMSAFTSTTSEDFSEIYREQDGDLLLPVRVYHPAYYKTLAVRLYNFNGEAVEPTQVFVVSSEERVNPEGVAYKLVTQTRSFVSYEAAVSFIDEQQSGNYEIVGVDPFMSPVPLEKLSQYTLVYSSAELVEEEGEGIIPAVKIFEYSRREN